MASRVACCISIVRPQARCCTRLEQGKAAAQARCLHVTQPNQPSSAAAAAAGAPDLPGCPLPRRDSARARPPPDAAAAALLAGDAASPSGPAAAAAPDGPVSGCTDGRDELLPKSSRSPTGCCCCCCPCRCCAPAAAAGGGWPRPSRSCKQQEEHVVLSARHAFALLGHRMPLAGETGMSAAANAATILLCCSASRCAGYADHA